MLIDTNILMELGMSQKRSMVCMDLLFAVAKGVFNEDVYITKFSLGALEAMLSNVNDNFLREILVLIYEGDIKIFNTRPEDDLLINSIKKDLGLDFDDALHYFATNLLHTYLVTYDKDFSHTGISTKTPEEVLETLKK